MSLFANGCWSLMFAGSALVHICTREVTLQVLAASVETLLTPPLAGGAGLLLKEWKKVGLPFAYSVSFLDPESSLRGPPCRGGPYFPGSPGSEMGLWSPDGPEVLGTSGREAGRPEGSPGGGRGCCCCSAEAGLFSAGASGFCSGGVCVCRRTEDASLGLFRADSGPWGGGGQSGTSEPIIFVTIQQGNNQVAALSLFSLYPPHTHTHTPAYLVLAPGSSSLVVGAGGDGAVGGGAGGCLPLEELQDGLDV